MGAFYNGWGDQLSQSVKGLGREDWKRTIGFGSMEVIGDPKE